MNSPLYRGYDQTELDLQYDTRQWAEDVEDWLQQRSELSRQVRDSYASTLDVPYGPGDDERLDVFPAERPDAPVLLYFHGGYWRSRSKEDVSFLASAFVPSGITFVGVDYSLAPSAPMKQMVRQVRAAVGWVHNHAGDIGVDAHRVHVAGHSAGAHLAATLLAKAWRLEAGLPDDVVKSGCLTSGLYDLEPIRLASHNRWLRLTEESATELSPIAHVADVTGSVVIAVGEDESDEFRRQSVIYFDAWQATGQPCVLLTLPQRHHYSMMVELSKRDSPLTQAAMEQIMAVPADEPGQARPDEP